MISPKTIKEGGAVILLRFLLPAKAILLKLLYVDALALNLDQM